MIILGHRWRMARIRSRNLAPCGFLLLRSTLPPIHLVAVIININRLHSIPIVRSLHMLRWRAWVLWTSLLVARGRRVYSARRSTLGRVAVLGLKRDGLFGVAWFLPCVSHAVSFTDKSASQAIIAFRVLFVTLLLSPSTSHASGFGTIAEYPFSSLAIQVCRTAVCTIVPVLSMLIIVFGGSIGVTRRHRVVASIVLAQGISHLLV